MKHVFDRIPRWDGRNLEYPIRELIGEDVPIKARRWKLPECLDQGSEGACVGFGWTHELLAEPVRVTGVDPFAVYHRAQQLDDWPGEGYYGTSVLAGAKVIQEMGHLKEYRWAFTVDDILATLVVHGPVVIGVNWHEKMAQPDAAGYIRPIGRILGGHCVCLRGVTQNQSGKGGKWAVLGRNSWGRYWGQRGDFKLTTDNLAKLLAAGGEACVPVTRA
jgi:hypothetical protein